ncbi:MAG: outer membrane beta-barrel protein [Rikenellaceae bacterium]
MSKHDINKEWSKAVGDRLRDAETPVSGELWERINSSSSFRKPFNNYRSLSIWAASLAALLIIGLLLMNKSSDIEEAAVLISELDTLTVEEDILNIEDVNLEEELTQDIIATNIVVCPPVEDKYQSAIKKHEASEQKDSEDDKYVKEEAVSIEDEPTQEKHTSKEKPSQQHTKANEVQQEKSYYANLAKYRSLSEDASSPATMLAFNFGGGNAKYNYASAVHPNNILSALLINKYDSETDFLESYETSEVSHRQPFIVALNVGQELFDKFRVGSGLSYTLLASEVNTYNETSAKKQKLHFIGLPLWASYDVLSYDKFALYAGGGTRLEYCVSAKVDDMKINENRWHSSVNAMVGAEYNVNKWLGFYCEPDLSYYFTKTKLKTIRNENAVSFSVRFGVKFMINGTSKF